MRRLRFRQFTTPSGIKAGWLRRSQVYSCDLCGAAVAADRLMKHTAFHDTEGHESRRPMDPGCCENRGDRLVDLDGGSVTAI